LLLSHLQASQDFRPNGRTVVNKAEVFGEKVFVTANGTYEPQVPRVLPHDALA